MTERKKKNFRRFHSKNGIENFSSFSSGAPKKECGVQKFLNNVGRGILSQSRMHVIKNFPSELTLDPSISIPM